MDSSARSLEPRERHISTSDSHSWAPCKVLTCLPASKQSSQPSVEINWRRETKVFFRRLRCPVHLGQGNERTFSASTAFRACVLSESATAKWSLFVACHLRVAISRMCLGGCQPLGRQTSVQEPLLVMN